MLHKERKMLDMKSVYRRRDNEKYEWVKRKEMKNTPADLTLAFGVSRSSSLEEHRHIN